MLLMSLNIPFFLSAAERVQSVVPRRQGFCHRRVSVCGARSPARARVSPQGPDQHQRVLPQEEDQRPHGEGAF